MRTRREKLERAVAAQMTKQQYVDSILDIYKKNGWYLKYKRRGVAVPYNAWAMFSEFERRYKQKFPDYNSPWTHRKKDFQDWLRRVDAAVKKRQKG